MQNNGMDSNPQDVTSYITQYHASFLVYLESEYCSKYRSPPVNKTEYMPSNNMLPSGKASGSDQFPFDLHDMPSDDEEESITYNVAETISG